ncbi:MAG TPA: hypothetical protein VFE85_00120 [Woeseiaceae bacterium]|nr:hypothetical protein [Woeseiaceae bacterium]
MNARIAVLAVVAVVAAGCVPTYTLVGPGTVRVGSLAVDAGGEWNHAAAGLTNGLRKGSEMWTRDGPLLDRLLLIPSVPDGAPLLVDRSKQAALPVFRSAMLPNELEELVESTLVKYLGEGNAAVDTSNLRPNRFGDHQGVLFDFSAAVSERPDFRGLAGAFIAGNALYVVIYMAAEPYYYGKHLADAEAVIRSARIVQAG